MNELTPEEKAQQQADAEVEIEAHLNKRGSKLEAHRVLIAKMRRFDWPYRRIADFLMTERGISVGVETVRSFCRARRIEKGVGETESREGSRRPEPRRSSKAHEAKRPRNATAPAPSIESESAIDREKEWDLVVPDHLETWKSQGDGKRPASA